MSADLTVQASAQSQDLLLSYLSGWVSLAYLALARRLRLRAHLLLVMPELCMQATACVAGLLERQDSRSLEQALSSAQGAQVGATLTLTANRNSYCKSVLRHSLPCATSAPLRRLCPVPRALGCVDSQLVVNSQQVKSRAPAASVSRHGLLCAASASSSRLSWLTANSNIWRSAVTGLASL